MELLYLLAAGFLLPFGIVLFFVNPLIGGLLLLIVYFLYRKHKTL
jgi:cbb3-type cytochrome oxidase subunit 3